MLWSSFDPSFAALYEAVLGVGLVGCGLQPDEMGLWSGGARSSPCELAGSGVRAAPKLLPRFGKIQISTFERFQSGQSLSCLQHERLPIVSHGKVPWRNLGWLPPLRYLRCALRGLGLSVTQQRVPAGGKREKNGGVSHSDQCKACSTGTTALRARGRFLEQIKERGSGQHDHAACCDLASGALRLKGLLRAYFSFWGKAAAQEWQELRMRKAGKGKRHGDGSGNRDLFLTACKGGCCWVCDHS